MESIDVHAHIVPREALPMLEHESREQAPRLVASGNGQRILTLHNGARLPATAAMLDAESRLAFMDAARISRQALSIVPSLMYYDLEPGLGLTFAQILNDAIAAVARRWPARFIPLATVPLQDPSRAVNELERAVRQLQMPGVEIGTQVNGRNLDASDLWSFYEAAEHLDVAILVHPHVDDIPARLRDYYLVNLLGYPAETSMAIASLIFGGVLEAFPRLRFCFVHGGGFVPFQRGRLEHGFQERPEPKSRVTRPPSEYLPLLYFDTLTHDVPTLAYLVQTIGPERLMLGSDYPFDMGDPDPVSTVESVPRLERRAQELILNGTARTFLRLPASAA